MKHYVDNGQAKLKKHYGLKSSLELVRLQPLVTQNLIGQHSTYLPINDVRFPKFDCSCIYQKPTYMEFVTSQIQSTANNLIESVICFSDLFILVTQVDVFIRNDVEVDPCATETYSMSYPGSPVAKVLQKSFKRVTWYELAIFYERIELLVAGGIYGYISGGDLKYFFYANLKLTKPIDVDTPGTVLLVRPVRSNIFCEERLLQNYCRPAANYKWGFRSAKFASKGFKTANPLYAANNPTEKAGSLILRCLAYNLFTAEDQEQLITNIHEAAVGYSIDIFRINDDLCYLRMLLPFCNGKLSSIAKAANKLIDGLSLSLQPLLVIDGSTATNIYTDIIKYQCTMINGNDVSKDAFLK